MNSFDIVLQPVKQIEGNRLTYYNTYGQIIDIIKAENRPIGYVYHNHKPRRSGPYTLNSVKCYLGNRELDFDIHFPLNNVSGFFVYYKQLHEDPLLICIQTINSEGYITHRYYCPRHKNRKSWMAVPELVLDPKWSTNFWEIKKRLDEQTTLMDGVILDLEKTYIYRDGHVFINPIRVPFNGYQVFTHELASQEPFHLKQVKFKEAPLVIKGLENYQVIAVHAIGKIYSSIFKPISVCVVKYGEKNSENIYEWYFRDNLDSKEWKPDERFAEHLDDVSIKNYINKLYDNLYELDIHIDKNVFYYNEVQTFTNKGISGKIYFSHIRSRFKKYVYSLEEERTFKIRRLTIKDQTQIISPNKVYSKFYMVCDDKDDKDYPLFMCFPESTTKYTWYRRIHYGSDNWIKCDELRNYDPENEIKDDQLENAYAKLFWIEVDIDYDKRLNLEDYVKNNRYIAKNVILHGEYTLIETVNYNFYPFFVKIVEKGKPLESVTEKERMHSVSVLYNPFNEPCYIIFEHADSFYKFFWYSKDKNSNKWSIVDQLKDKNPKEHIYRLIPANRKGIPELIGEKEQKEQEEEEKVKTITSQALGTTVGTAACCGLGYFLYSNASSIAKMFTSFFS
ncbi:hypothetical protein MACK_001692 [Theileria orientalis]|uniref:Uncharacterized protein n=1 Tax=Theileria orientalis TaxID=68886 RepID=A0A976MDF5_THEOR|nr:hypothetical protein MACK_001692 [Theileria orientalis]